MPIQYASLPEEAQQELAALITQTPGFSAAYAYRLRSSPRGAYTTTVVADPDEARIFINANFEEVVGIPLPISIQKPAHKAVLFHSDGSISLRPKFKVGEQVLLHKVITWATITGYVVSGDGLFYTSDRGGLTEDEALSEKELDRCPQCAARALYAEHCHDCGWDVEDDSPCRHPALTAAERNSHVVLAWK